MTFKPLSSEGLFKALEKIKAFRGDEEISLTELYTATYEGLDPLFDGNIPFFGEGDEPLSETQKRTIISRWKEELERKELRVVGQRITDDETVEEIVLDVSPRTNFMTDRDRRPSILQLTDQNGNFLYFRVAQHYHPRDIPSFGEMDFNFAYSADPTTLARGQRITVDGSWYTRFNNGRKGRLRRNPLGKMRYKSPLVFIPEPHLLGILEALYNEGVPRITPRVKVLEVTDKELILVRPPLQQILDASIDKAMA